MFELIFRQMFSAQRRNTVAEQIYRIEQRMDKNEKVEEFLMRTALRYKDSIRSTIRWTFYFGIVFGYMLARESNHEIDDLFKVTDLSPETKKTLGIN